MTRTHSTRPLPFSSQPPTSLATPPPTPLSPWLFCLGHNDLFTIPLHCSVFTPPLNLCTSYPRAWSGGPLDICVAYSTHTFQVFEQYFLTKKASASSINPLDQSLIPFSVFIFLKKYFSFSFIWQRERTRRESGRQRQKQAPAAQGVGCGAPNLDPGITT